MNRSIFILGILFLTLQSINAQKRILIKNENKENKEIFSTILKDSANTFGALNEKVSFGLSLGYNLSIENLKTAYISPINNTVIINNLQKNNFVLSSVVSVPITFKKNKYYRYKTSKGEWDGEINKIADFSIIGVINLVTFQGATSGSVFNQKLSGGLGLAYNLDNDISIAISYELNSYRKPKDFLMSQLGQVININGNDVTNLDENDNNYFYDRYAGTIGLKVIYKLTTKK